MQNALDMLRDRGLIEQISDEPALRAQFAAGSVPVYAGFDPTADSLHLGHLLPVLCLARLQRLGHRPITLVGGATGMIGDPSGKTEERQLLSVEKIDSNVEGLKRQLERFLDFSGSNGASMVNNADWTSQVTYIDWLRDVGKHFNISYMMGKESVRRRIEDRAHGISYTEFSYMLIQANDFLELYDRHGCLLEVGGNDQWGNITAGIDLIHRKRHRQAYGITFPLLVTATGEKFGKSAGNAIWLDPERTSPYALYQYWIGADDRDVVKYLKFFTFLAESDIADLAASVTAAPERREAQRVLAEESTRMIHGEDGLAKAQAATEVLFGGEMTNLTDRELLDIFADVPASTISREELEQGIGILALYTRTGLTASNGQALQLVKQGGVYINNRRIDDQRCSVTPEHLEGRSVLILRKGKKQYHVVRFEG